jgi:hypothetical protein
MDNYYPPVGNKAIIYGNFKTRTSASQWLALFLEVKG